MKQSTLQFFWRLLLEHLVMPPLEGNQASFLVLVCIGYLDLSLDPARGHLPLGGNMRIAILKDRLENLREIKILHSYKTSILRYKSLSPSKC